jgi:hypothetical protein
LDFQDKLATRLPIYFRIQDDQKPFAAGEPGNLAVTFRCSFRGEIVCPQLWMQPFSRVRRSEALFSVDDARLFDGASANLAGSFDLPARHIPHYLTVRAGCGWFQTGLPLQRVSNCPKLRLPPVSLAVEMPRFLLPNR